MPDSLNTATQTKKTIITKDSFLCGQIIGFFGPLFDIHKERVEKTKKDILDRLREKYGEDIPQAILNTIDYIVQECYKSFYANGYNDKLMES